MIPALPIGSLFISELIGKEMITETYKSINSSIYNIQSFDIELVNQILEELDILKKIEIVNSLFENLETLHDKTKVMDQIIYTI